ncbi:MAG: YggS family pyridoxal phosphate-dependent enzyme [Bacteroidales bacterium]|nr:YggS family pyridoxal phosphate-dependent enzyme [Bacteroidales bacterium]
MSVRENLLQVKSQVPDNVCLIAVSKTKPVEAIQEAYDCGQRVFGENKAQEMRDKHAVLPHDIQWHMIGHLQENKIKYIIPYVTMIHSIDSLKLLKEVNKKAIQCERVVDCLIEMDISHEDSKFGLSIEELRDMLESEDFQAMNNVRICGLMGIGSITDDREKTRQEFRNLKNMFEDIRKEYFQDKEYFTHISMGMSGDYDIAIEEGSTFVRVGSKIFGERDYSKKN